MDQRERDINKDIDDAEQAKLNAQKLEAQNKQTLKETQEEVHKILEESKIQARKQHEEIIHEANINISFVNNFFMLFARLNFRFF